MTVALDTSKLTPIERAFFFILRDGDIHHPDEFIGEVLDELAEATVVRAHICNMRRKIESQGLLITFVQNNGHRGYQMSRRIKKDDI